MRARRCVWRGATRAHIRRKSDHFSRSERHFLGKLTCGGIGNSNRGVTKPDAPPRRKILRDIFKTGSKKCFDTPREISLLSRPRFPITFATLKEWIVMDSDCISPPFLRQDIEFLIELIRPNINLPASSASPGISRDSEVIEITFGF